MFADKVKHQKVIFVYFLFFYIPPNSRYAISPFFPHSLFG